MPPDTRFRILVSTATKCAIFASAFALALCLSDAQMPAPSLPPFSTPSAEVQLTATPYPKAIRIPKSSDEAQQSPKPVAKATPTVGESPKTLFPELQAKAEAGNADAQFGLGNCYYEGVGQAKNMVEAVKWYRKAAEQDYADAQLSLGNCYKNGEGVAKNMVEAVKWYRKAAEQNDAKAQVNLGVSYEGGEGVAKNIVEAVKWYRKAAEQNDADAQNMLGLSYGLGLGVPKDEVVGYKWLLLAAAQGDESVRESIAFLESQLTREQIAEGQKLARDFKPKDEEIPVPDSENAKPVARTPEGAIIFDNGVTWHPTGTVTWTDRATGRVVVASKGKKPRFVSAGTLHSGPKSSGTGFFITEDGYLITNRHVAGNGAQVRLATAHGLIPAKVVKVDAANDLALLKAEGTFAALPVAASRGVKLGNTVATVGFPDTLLQGFNPKLAKGEIASLSGMQDDARYFQISVPVQPGNSGGALVDERGNVVGIVSAKLSAKEALAKSGQLPENV